MGWINLLRVMGQNLATGPVPPSLCALCTVFLRWKFQVYCLLKTNLLMHHVGTASAEIIDVLKLGFDTDASRQGLKISQ